MHMSCQHTKGLKRISILMPFRHRSSTCTTLLNPCPHSNSNLCQICLPCLHFALKVCYQDDFHCWKMRTINKLQTDMQNRAGVNQEGHLWMPNCVDGADPHPPYHKLPQTASLATSRTCNVKEIQYRHPGRDKNRARQIYVDIAIPMQLCIVIFFCQG